LAARTAEPAHTRKVLVNLLVEALEVLVDDRDQILEPQTGLRRDSPSPHRHGDIIRTYVRTVKALRSAERGERIPFVVTAIVLIEAERSAIAKLGPALADVPGVAEAYSVTGEFDFVAILRVKNHEEIADIVTSKLSQVAGIRKTHTHVAFKVYSKHDLEAMFSVGLQEAR
jgi:DNA-binding Lrp family transcriptional regulator